MKAYLPSDDTFLLSDEVKRYRAEAAIEMGAGSGYVTEELARKCEYVVGTDIDLRAIREAKDRLRRAGVWGHIDLISCDKATPFLDEVFDLVVFNPPYLPSERLRDVAVDGGRRGIALATGFFEEGKRILKDEGRVVFVASSLSDYRRLFAKIRGMGFDLRVAKRKRLFFEELMAVTAVRRDRVLLT